MAARGFLGAGDVYIERIVGGVAQGLKGPFYADKFQIKPNVDIKELVSKGRDDYGQTLESVALQKPADFTLELKEVNKESMALALLGTQAAVSQGSGTLTDQEVTTKADCWVSVSKQALGATITVKDSATGLITYAEGTDYVLNRQLGLIKALSTGAIAADAHVDVSGTYSAISGTVINGATSADVRARFLFDGINQADGLPCIVEVYEGVIAANSAFDFLANDFANVSLPGKMKTPSGKSEPFTVTLRSA